MFINNQLAGFHYNLLIPADYSTNYHDKHVRSFSVVHPPHRDMRDTEHSERHDSADHESEHGLRYAYLLRDNMPGRMNIRVFF